MPEWFFDLSTLLREIRRKAMDAKARLAEGDKQAAKLINGYMKSEYESLYRQWSELGFPTSGLGSLGRHIHFGDPHDYDDILSRDLEVVQVNLENHAREAGGVAPAIGFENLLHPVIYEHAYQHYINGHYRDAVLNAVVAIFDLIRERTALDMDGAALIGQVFSLETPHLVLSNLSSDSGRNDQKGFLQIFQGAYLGIRNPKAHSLVHDLDAAKAAQYLVFASLLARRVQEAKKVKKKVDAGAVAAAAIPAASASNAPRSRKPRTK